MSAVVSDTINAQLSTPVSWQLHFSPHRGESVISVDIDAVRFRVGRREGLNLTLSSLQVSGWHAEFVLVGFRLFVRDMGSTNGTYVNGKRIDHLDFALRHGDWVRMADREMIVHRLRTNPAAGDTALLQDTVIAAPAVDMSSTDSAPDHF